MRAYCALILVCMLSTAGAQQPKPAATPAHGGAQGYDGFRLVHTRNVFDPDRRPVRPPGPAVASSAPTRADYVSLTGIAVDGEKALAFFSGSRTEFNKVVPAGEGVAGSTVTRITPMSIEIERKGRHLTVNVGQTVPLDDKSLPAAAPVDAAVAPAASAGPNGSATAPGASPAPGSSPAATLPGVNLDEVRRRMMERHEQDQK